jgi:uncharacterized protein (DUF2237 family)
VNRGLKTPAARRRRALALGVGVAMLLVLLAVPAAASAAFTDDFADADHPQGNSKDWVEVFPAALASATKEAGEPDHAGDPGGHSVWLSWNMYDDQVAQATACGTKGGEPVVAVYTGDAIDELTELASQAEEDSRGCAVLRFAAKAGTTYRIAVDAKSGPGSMYFFMNRLPGNDDFADAMVLDEFPTVDQVDPQIATTEPGEPDHPGYGEGNSVWYRWTAIESGLARVGSCDYWAGADFSVYTGSAIDELTEVAAGTGGGGNCGHAGEARFHAVAGTTYMIAVEGYPGRDGDLGIYFAWVEKHLLAVTTTGSGSGTVVSDPAGIECGRSCEAGFYYEPIPYGITTVELAATPAPGSVFTGWSGEGCSGTGPCELAIQEVSAAVTADFEAEPSLTAPPPDPISEPPPAAEAPAAARPPSQPPPKPGRKAAKCRKKVKGAKGEPPGQRHRACRR